MNRFLLLVLAACGCSSPPSIPLPEPLPQSSPVPEIQTAPRLKLEEALALADRVHPELAEAQARADASRGRADQSGAWPNPALMGRIEGAGSDDQREYVAGFSQGLPIGGRLGAAERVETIEAERLGLELEARRRTVRSRVQAAFAAALFTQQAFSLQKEASTDAESAVALALSLAAAGEGLNVDVARARIEFSKVSLERDRADSLAQEALIELAATIGQPGLRVAVVEGSLESALELPTLESIAAELAEHPVLKAARAGVRAQEARLELALAQRIPDVTLELLYRRLDATEEDALDAGLSVTLPIFNRNRGAMREARAERRAAEARVEKSAIDLQRDLHQAHLRLSRALTSSRALRDGVLAQQDEIARAYEARYSAGDASLADVLPVRREKIATRLLYLEALREVMEAWAALSPFLSTTGP